ncbi:ABC transporter permease [Nitratiruptor sp. SB155-2]|uniref:ABC transporter permease n=1 Tax=Nitratiruptor sp. (strain SB155-2) TaxID=387092 RepID=UPI0001587039|nr:ABC transporter permease [Nitratiruptor sp. SB155-2]BAF70833.1 multidrug ABC transporter, permease [Nitratiruptor sp. SB155-2]
MRTFQTILAKEILTFLRSWGLVAVVLYSFTLDIYIVGQGIEVKPRNISIGYVDHAHTPLVPKILSHLHVPEFQKPIRFPSQRALQQAVFNKKIIVGVIFDQDFAKQTALGGNAKLDLLIDSTAASQAYITSVYLQNVLLNLFPKNFPVDLCVHKLFNQNADSRMFMSFVEMLSIITMIGIILTAVVFVKEKEDGTWDILLLSPVESSLIIFAKALSQVLIVMGGTILALGFVVLTVFDTPVNGSFLAFLLLTLLYSLTISGIGLFIASVSKTVMQVAQLSMLIMLPLIFLSGAWTPIYSMHPVLQKLSLFSPLRYYIEGSESIIFRGTQWEDLLPYFLGVALLGILTFWYGYKKIGRLF